MTLDELSALLKKYNFELDYDNPAFTGDFYLRYITVESDPENSWYEVAVIRDAKNPDECLREIFRVCDNLDMNSVYQDLMEEAADLGLSDSSSILDQARSVLYAVERFEDNYIAFKDEVDQILSPRNKDSKLDLAKNVAFELGLKVDDLVNKYGPETTKLGVAGIAGMIEYSQDQDVKKAGAAALGAYTAFNYEKMLNKVNEFFVKHDNVLSRFLTTDIGDYIRAKQAGEEYKNPLFAVKDNFNRAVFDDFICDHRQALEDLENHFDGKTLDSLGDEACMGWLEDHDQLFKDYCKFKSALAETAEKGSKGKEIVKEALETAKGGCGKHVSREAEER